MRITATACARRQGRPPRGARASHRITSIGGQALMEGIMMRGPRRIAIAVRNTKGEIVLEETPVPDRKRAFLLRAPLIRGVFAFADAMAIGYRSLMRSARISGLEELEAEMEREKAAKKAAKAAKRARKAKAADGKAAGTAEPADPAATVPTEEPAEADAERVPTEEKIEADAGPAPVAEHAEAGTGAEPDGAGEAGPAPAAEPADEGSAAAKEGKEGKRGSSFLTTLTLVIPSILALAIVVMVFFYLPSALYNLLVPFIGTNRFVRSAVEGVVKTILLVGYMGLMPLIQKDIRRTFRYHGAEHKTIFCYEHGKDLTVENVRLERRFHPRCGTSFLILTLLVGILIGFLIPPAWPAWGRVLAKLLLLPLTMGVGYELIRLCGRHENWLTRVIAAPGLCLQRITVFEPDDGMIECAIAAMKAVIPEDGSDLCR